MRRIAIGVLVGALVVAGCGGGSDDAQPDGDGEPAASETGGDERPEGAWTFVRTQLERSDAPDLDPGISLVELTELDPSCGSGPCDIEMTPAGADDTYLPEGLVVSDPAPPDPRTLVWSESSETYTIDFGERETSCTTADGDVVDDAYRLTTVVTLSFVAPEDGAPARLEGSYERTVASTPEGEAKGCTAYDESGSYVGSPTGALDDLDLSGEYVTTEYVDTTEPEQVESGFVGLLPTMTVTHDGDTLSVAGVLVTSADLEHAQAGWSGSTDEVSGPCTAEEAMVTGGFTSVETWTDLTAAALTADGDPILAGRWSLMHEPTDAGTAAGCSTSTNTGYIVLVPSAALG